jgi:signal transduction histidine kinase
VGAAVAAVLALVGAAYGENGFAAGALGLAGVAAAALGVYVILEERRRHESVEGELSAQASFLESLVESFGAIAATLDADRILEQTRQEAERLFGGDARILDAGGERRRAPAEQSALVPMRVRGDEIAALHVTRRAPFARDDVIRLTVLADFAARAVENAQLLAEAQVREAERARLSDQLITAEQDERRRLALFLHDTSVQSLSGIALMLDAAKQFAVEGRGEEADTVIANCLTRLRDTIRGLRDLSFNLEPVVLRDQGFGPAVHALAEQVGLSSEVRVDFDVAAAESLAEKAQAALYQIIREALTQSARRGPPTTIKVAVRALEGGGVETLITDDGTGERRRASFETLEERARPLNGTVEAESTDEAGTTVRVVFPAYSVHS